jgi:CRISPR-associated protein Cmr2
VLVSALEYLSTRSRLKKYSETLLTSVEGSWHSSAQHAPMGAPPWLRMPQGGWETIWLDLAEIYDLLAEEQHNA